MRFFGICFFLLMFVSSGLADDGYDSRAFPRPLIIEYPQNNEFQLKESLEEIRLHCTSWRFAAEANNLNPWKTIPPECAGYIEEYMTGRGYHYDLERVSKEAQIFANSVKLGDDGRDIWVFDVDETLLSNLPYYARHGFGLEIFDHAEFDKWVEEGIAPAINSSLELYRDVLKLGIKVFFLTGRRETHRNVTVENLIKVGFEYWEKLILRSVCFSSIKLEY
ncbi:OLC1v1027109C2 [Oldenlandia corymbosa var. corymbosa]|uniref:OLC1v1027109C2 n=1 Tax=Oldenlandia corymbosa var. corymbosa TaxID=529605 RepID=A0AAV1C976_OLDCO|nr:OLC1v1027109C2 [Oldenlandia corymbosa var. corymbosa]